MIQAELVPRTLYQRCVEFDRAMLKRWSDAELRAALDAVAAGHHDEHRAHIPGRVLPVTLRAIAEEAVHRGWLKA